MTFDNLPCSDSNDWISFARSTCNTIDLVQACIFLISFIWYLSRLPHLLFIKTKLLSGHYEFSPLCHTHVWAHHTWTWLQFHVILGLTFEFIFVLCYLNIIHYQSQVVQTFFTLIVIVWLFILLFDFKTNCRKDKSITFHIAIHKLFFETTQCALTANTIAFVGISIGFILYSFFTQYWSFVLFSIGFHAALSGDILTHIRIWYCKTHLPPSGFEDYCVQCTDLDDDTKLKSSSKESSTDHDINDDDTIDDQPNLIDTLQMESIKILDADI